MVHAAVGIAEENSGKLVTIVRRQAKLLAEKHNLDYIIVASAPGVGCPVISSITGADAVLIVTESTLSGIYDLRRMVSLSKGYFNTPTYVCVNKYDINLDMINQSEEWFQKEDLGLAGKLPYDQLVTEAMVHTRTVIEHTDGSVAESIRTIWQQLETKKM